MFLWHNLSLFCGGHWEWRQNLPQQPVFLLVGASLALFLGSSLFLCFRPSDCILTVCTYVRFQVQTRTEQETDLRSCRLGPCVGAKVVLLSETGDVAWCWGNGLERSKLHERTNCVGILGYSVLVSWLAVLSKPSLSSNKVTGHTETLFKMSGNRVGQFSWKCWRCITPPEVLTAGFDVSAVKGKLTGIEELCSECRGKAVKRGLDAVLLGGHRRLFLAL